MCHSRVVIVNAREAVDLQVHPPGRDVSICWSIRGNDLRDPSVPRMNHHGFARCWMDAANRHAPSPSVLSIIVQQLGACSGTSNLNPAIPAESVLGRTLCKPKAIP